MTNEIVDRSLKEADKKRHAIHRTTKKDYGRFLIGKNASEKAVEQCISLLKNKNQNKKPYHLECYNW